MTSRAGSSGRWWPAAVAVVMSLAVVVLYRASLGYGLMWDDPVWFLRGSGRSAVELLRGSRDYQFYRPLAMWCFPAGGCPTGRWR